MVTQSNLEHALKEYIDPFLGTDLVSSKAVTQLVINDNNVLIEIVLGYPFSDNEQQAAIHEYLQRIFPEANITLKLSWKIESRVVQPGMQGIPEIKNIIAVASGKGGVGKSTTAVNLALALAKEGARVGILDADIYGPNQPQMLGVHTTPDVKDQKKIRPIVSHGIQSMSIGYLIDKNTPIVWRGPMVTGALLQLLNETQWESLDYLFIDLPPGTGDIQLTLAQKIPVCAAIIVTTPQEVALLDARKGIEMFRKVKIPLLGVVENMSVHVCSQCGHQEPIFGLGGGQKIAQEYETELLGQLPLIKAIREYADNGNPIVVADPQGEIAKLYRQVAKKIAAKLSLQARSYTNRFPKIVIENS